MAGWMAASGAWAQGRCPHGVIVDAVGAGVAGAAVEWRHGGVSERVLSGAEGGFAFACSGGQAANSPTVGEDKSRDNSRSLRDDNKKEEAEDNSRSLRDDNKKAGSIAYPLTASRNGTVRAAGGGLESGSVEVPATGEVRVVARPRELAEQVSVTATRTGVEVGPQAQTVTALSRAELTQFPALTLDERLRQKAGFELFRRASSWVANPTSQGISLRGLGSTAASRTLVIADGVPLNDAFGGWIHWNEIPPDAIEGVTIATGGGSDLYGSSALGGVIDVLPARARATRFTGGLTGGGLDTLEQHGRGDLAVGPWSGLAAAEGFRTAGYVPLAPPLVGSIDRPANVHYQNGRVELARVFGAAGGGGGEAGSSLSARNGSKKSNGKAGLAGDSDFGGNSGGTLSQRVFVNGNVLNEARGNGTELQTNGTRLWRWVAGDDWTAGERAVGKVRVFGSDQRYRQTFSAINAARSVEALTRSQRVRDEEVGGSADATVPWAGRNSSGAAVFGVDVRDIRATDVETPISGGRVTSVQQTPARQRFVGGFGEVLASAGGWSGSASLRADAAENLDTRMFGTNAVGVTSPVRVRDRSELAFSPRIGLVRTLPRGWQIEVTGFRAFRAPTMNELYRTGQVGQETTLANAQLENERATGVEGGANWRGPRVAAHAGYFWTEINRPVSAVLVSATATTITNRRQNLGQIVSQGLEATVGLNEGHALSGTIGVQYAHATVTAFAAQPRLVGRWIPNVPRTSVTAQLRAQRARWGVATVALRAAGRQYDDSSNIFPLSSFALLDVYGERGLGKGFTAFVAVQNLLNQRPEVARTPNLTLGSPVLAQGGVRFGWGGR